MYTPRCVSTEVFALAYKQTCVLTCGRGNRSQWNDFGSRFVAIPFKRSNWITLENGVRNRRDRCRRQNGIYYHNPSVQSSCLDLISSYLGFIFSAVKFLRYLNEIWKAIYIVGILAIALSRAITRTQHTNTWLDTYRWSAPDLKWTCNQLFSSDASRTHLEYDCARITTKGIMPKDCWQ